MRLNHDFMRCQPLTPTMAIAIYWVIFAKPKNITNSVVFAVAGMGRRDREKESI